MELALNIFGIAITSWMNYGFTFLPNNSVSWRFPLAFQSFWAISPRWLVLKGRQEEAHAIIARLVAKPADNDEVTNALQVLVAMTMRRILLGAGIALMQQACGVNIIANYLPIVLTRSVGLPARLSSILAACYSHLLIIWATSSMMAIDSFGRKKLLLLGALGQGISFFMAAVGIRVGSYSMSIFTVVFIFVYDFFFGISFLSIPWLYPAEINSQHMRNVGTSISTTTNWIFVYVIILVTQSALRISGGISI